MSLRRAARGAVRLALLEAAQRGAVARLASRLTAPERRHLAADLRTVATILMAFAMVVMWTRAYPLAAVGALAAWPLWLADRVDV